MIDLLDSIPKSELIWSKKWVVVDTGDMQQYWIPKWSKFSSNCTKQPTKKLKKPVNKLQANNFNRLNTVNKLQANIQVTNPKHKVIIIKNNFTVQLYIHTFVVVHS
jgi:hypothetical protein